MQTVRNNKGDIKMKNYKTKKEQARQQAIYWQIEWGKTSHFWSECAEASEKFKKLGKQYGLLKEFKENGIIQGVKYENNNKNYFKN